VEKTWQEVHQSAFVPEIGDYGSVVVMVREDGVVNEISYTINDGFEWPTCVFTTEAFDVSNIRVDPEWDSRRFVLYGVRDTGNQTSQAVIIQLNFDDEFSGPCQQDDFEMWSPTDENNKCVMGVSKNYKKRKTGHTCYFGQDYNPFVSETVCACTVEDYECDYCFYRAELTSPCTLECDQVNLPPAPAECQGTYEADIGYRLVDNTKCDPKAATAVRPKVQLLCPQGQAPTPSPTGLRVILAIMGFIIFISIIGVVFYFLRKKNESFRNFLKNTLGFEDEESKAESRYTTVAQGDNL